MRRHCATHCAPEMVESADALGQPPAQQQPEADPAYCASLVRSGTCTKNVAYMSEHCPQSCSVDAGEASATSTTPAQSESASAHSPPETPPVEEAAAKPSTPAAPEDKQCPEWAALGYCGAGAYVDYMHNNCAQTCAARKVSGEVDTLQQVDAAQCATYVRNGACKTHGQYMRGHCSGACEGSRPLGEEEVVPAPIGPVTLVLLLALFGFVVYHAAQFASKRDQSVRRIRSSNGAEADADGGSKGGHRSSKKAKAKRS